MNLVLIGFRGTGKTTAGRKWAEIRGLDFMDVDELIEARYGRKISDIFNESGEDVFRRMEFEVIRSLRGTDGKVIAAGGGAVIHEENREILKRLGRVVWLKASPERVVERIENSGRPPLTGLEPAEEVKALTALREKYYAETADHVIDTSFLTVTEVVDAIEQFWRVLPDNDIR